MDREELRITAELAMLDLSEEEMKAFEAEVSKTLEYFNHMGELDLENLESADEVPTEENRVRRDKISAVNISDRLLDGAPQREGRHIVIPKVL